MLDLKEKYGELKEDAGTIKKNINKLSVILENEKASVLELQKEIQNSYDLLMEKIAASNRKEEEIKLKQDELENLRKELVEKDIENKTLTQNIKTLTKDNKELQEKLYQKEQDELKFKILTNETSINIENLKKKMDEQNEKIQQYKAEIENLKYEIEKQKKIDIISIPLDIDSDQKLTVNNINSLEEEIEKKPEEFKTYYLNEEKNNGDIAIEFVSQESKLDSCLTNFEKPLVKNIKDQYEKKEQKIYIDLLKESKLNNIQEFILNRSKSLDDPEELSTNDWKKILNFGVSYKILTNREIQQLKQISLMLGNSGYKSERNEILNKVKENGFEISLYKAEDWEKVLEFLVETKGITKEVKDGFEGIFKKYKKKKMFKLEQLKFILPYLEKYKENMKKIEIESKDDFLEKEEESCLTPFGKSLNENYIEKEECDKTLDIVTNHIMDSIEEKAEKNTSLVKLSNENIEELNTKILAIESNEWLKIKQWLHENNILDCSHQKKVGYSNFCDVLRCNKKLTTGQMTKAKDLYAILEEAKYDFGKNEKSDSLNIKNPHEDYYNQIQDIINKAKNIDIKIDLKITERVLLYLEILENFYKKEYIESKKLEFLTKVPFSTIKKDLSMFKFDEMKGYGYYVRSIKATLKLFLFNLDSSENIAEKIPKIELSNAEKTLLEELMTFRLSSWNKLLNWARKNNKLGKNCYNILTPLVNGRSLKGILGSDTLELLDLYSYLKDEGFENDTIKKNIKSTEDKNEINENEKKEVLVDETNKNMTNLILSKLERIEGVRTFAKEEWKSILDFGIQYGLFNLKETLKAEKLENTKRRGILWDKRMFTMGETIYKIVERNGYNASIFDFFEWNQVLNHLKNNNIITPNIIHEFYAISNESEETGFFSLEQLKFISPYLDKFKELINNKEEIEDTSSLDEMSIDMDEKESGEVEGNKFEEFKESKYDLSKMQDRTLRALKLFTSKNWKNLSTWSDNRLLIENEDIEVLNSLINGKPVEEFKELELIGLIELYDYLVEEGFNNKDFNLEEEEKCNTTLKELKSFDMEDWRGLYDWSDKKLLIQHEDHKLLAPLVNGNPIGKMEESNLINLSNLYKRLLEKGFKKGSDISEEKEINVLEKENLVSEDELLEEVRNFKSKDWIDMLDWAKNNKKLKTQDYNILSNLAFRSINNKLNVKELVLGLEVYFLAKSEGFELVKEKDVDDFLLQFMDDEKSIGIEEEYKTNKNINSTDDLKNGENIQKLNFKDLINKGLESGFIEYTMLEQINYEKEIEINDHFEAIEELEDRGIVIKY